MRLQGFRIRNLDSCASAEEGWLRELRTPRSDLSRADGVVLVRKSCILLTNTTPSAPSKVAAPFLFDVAATPPQLRRGALARRVSRTGMRLQEFRIRNLDSCASAEGPRAG